MNRTEDDIGDQNPTNESSHQSELVIGDNVGESCKAFRHRFTELPLAATDPLYALATRGGPWLFPSLAPLAANGGRWTGSELLNRLHKRLDEVGIRHGVLHTFRHTGASLFANGPDHPMSLPHLQKFLGHKSIKTTQRYLHSDVKDVAAAVRRVNLDRATTPAIGMPPATNSAESDAQTGKGGEQRRKAS